MQEDFHYYGTYCAAQIAGYSHEESFSVAWASQFVDCCSRLFLTKVSGPKAAATTQTQMEMADARTDPVGLQDITRIWASFHFLPADLYASLPRHGRAYMARYRLICGPGGPLVSETVELAKGNGLEACGLAMHVLADTWAHRYFAGTPTFVINNATRFEELVLEDGTETAIPVTYGHNPAAADDLELRHFTNTLPQRSETSVMNLGHGRAGHLPDYSFIRYRYLPAWGAYEYLVKDNPEDYYRAFCQMVNAMQYIRGAQESFDPACSESETAEPWRERIQPILRRRQLLGSEDWKAFGEELSGQEIPDFDVDANNETYLAAAEENKDDTPLGRFILAALAQKSMVTARIFQSGNLLAGFSVDFRKSGFQGIRDFRRLIMNRRRRED